MTNTDGVPDVRDYLKNFTEEVLTRRFFQEVVRDAIGNAVEELQEAHGKESSFDGKPAHDLKAVVGVFFECFRQRLHGCEYILATRLKRDSNRHLAYTMPRPKQHRPKVTKPALTLVERRARDAEEKLKSWQRKAKLAATKIKKYKKKFQYYRKKGAI